MLNFQLILVRTFHSTPNHYQEARYLVNDQWLTRTEITSIRPIDRTVAHWAVLVDWDLQRIQPFVVVDPFDPSGLLYLKHNEYLVQARACANNDLQLVVVARPGSKAPLSDVNPSQNSPYPVGIESRMSRQARASWKTFQDLRTQVRDVVTLKRGTKMVSVSHSTVLRTVWLWSREILHYAEVKKPGVYLGWLNPMITHYRTILRSNGQAQLIQRMKISLFALYSYVGGNPLTSTVPLGQGIRLSNGLPTEWGPHLRDLIRRDRLPVIRIMASILNLYRALYAVHPAPDVGSITKKAPALEEDPLYGRFQVFCQKVFPAMVAKHFESGRLPNFRYSTTIGNLVRSAGANLSGPSSGGLILDAIAWSQQPVNHVLEWFRFHDDMLSETLLTSHAKEAYWHPKPGAVGMVGATLMSRSATKIAGNWGLQEEVPKPILGRLHAIDEPAGKVRVVAICDYFTQLAMGSVHDHLFSILTSLRRNDATFDQQGVVDAYFQRGLSPHWSYDLKAATDSIPIALYRAVLPAFLTSKGESDEIGRQRTELWIKVLTDREWLHPDGETLIRYGTGQPMGALSSWPSMALVHHALVQFAAYIGREEKQRRGWFEDYLVLGDDVDISTDNRVADSYRDICSSFSITIGIAKSLTSNKNFFEFANQRFHPEGNISPISFKEELSASTWMSRIEYARRILSRFGSSSKDAGFALLRKAMTARQYARVIPELSGFRPSVYLKLLKFCLLNPFSHCMENELRVGSILEWLSPWAEAQGIDLKPYLEPTERRRELETEVLRRLSELVKTEASNIVQRSELKSVWPFDPRVSETRDLLTMHLLSLKDEGQEALRALGARQAENLSISKEDREFLDSFDPNSLESSYEDVERYLDLKSTLRRIDSVGYTGSQDRTTFDFAAPYALSYLFYCVSLHNKKIWDLANDTLLKLETLLSFSEITIPGDLTPWGRPQSDTNPIGRVFELWKGLRGFGKPIELNLARGLSYSLDYQGKLDDWKLAQRFGWDRVLRAKRDGHQLDPRPETMYGPVREVIGAIASITGIEPPNLLYFNSTRETKHWTKWMRSVRREYLERLSSVSTPSAETPMDLNADERRGSCHSTVNAPDSAPEALCPQDSPNPGLTGTHPHGEPLRPDMGSPQISAIRHQTDASGGSGGGEVRGIGSVPRHSSVSKPVWDSRTEVEVVSEFKSSKMPSFASLLEEIHRRN